MSKAVFGFFARIFSRRTPQLSQVIAAHKRGAALVREVGNDRYEAFNTRERFKALAGQHDIEAAIDGWIVTRMIYVVGDVAFHLDCDNFNMKISSDKRKWKPGTPVRGIAYFTRAHPIQD